jgi:hypothetical protein
LYQRGTFIAFVAIFAMYTVALVLIKSSLFA